MTKHIIMTVMIEMYYTDYDYFVTSGNGLILNYLLEYLMLRWLMVLLRFGVKKLLGY